MSDSGLSILVATPQAESSEARGRRQVILVEARIGSRARPEAERFLGSLGSGALRVIEPIELRISEVDDQVVAEAPHFDEFGQGSNRSEAVADLQATLVELFERLEAEQASLGADLARVWEALRRHVARQA